MGLFARDEKDTRLDNPSPSNGFGTEPTSTVASRPEPPPPPVARERSGGGEARETSVHLGRGSRVSGKLSFDGTARIDGEVEGEIAAEDLLIIEESAVVTAQIAGTTIVVKGTVTGNIRASERIEMRAPAKVEGDVVTPALVIHEGARFDGRCSMGRADAQAEPRKPVAAVKKS